MQLLYSFFVHALLCRHLSKLHLVALKSLFQAMNVSFEFLSCEELHVASSDWYVTSILSVISVPA